MAVVVSWQGGRGQCARGAGKRNGGCKQGGKQWVVKQRGCKQGGKWGGGG